MTQIAMAQISRKRWQAPLGIHSGAVAAEHRLYGYAMPEIMKPWSTPIRGATQSDLPRQADERLPGIVMAHARAMAGYEKRLDVAPVEVVVASLQISSQRGTGRRMKRDQTRFAELPITNRQNPLVKVYINEVQPQRFTDPQSRDTQQSVERIAHPPRYAGRADSMLQRLREEALNLLVGIQIEAVASVRARHQICGRHLGSGVLGAVVDRKPSYRPESQPLIRRISRWVLAHPADHPLPGDAPYTVPLHEP